MKNIISRVEPGSIAEELGVEPGDALVAVNGGPVRDVFDFRFETADEAFTITIEKPDGEEWELEIERGEDEELGITFEDGLMDDARHCANRCVFCFIDQNPPGMRETIYFKDDDARLSFLRGNYVTLTNMSEADFERILKYHLSPVNVSVHATEPTLRCKLLGNPKAGDALARIKRLMDAGIDCNFQIVLCKGLNDGAALDKTIRDLAGTGEHAKSLSVVPVGLTKHRAGLYPLEAFTCEDAGDVIRQVRSWQYRFRRLRGEAFVYLADEFYLRAKWSVPFYESYDGFPQLENGVGMLALEEHKFTQALQKTKRRVTLSAKKTILVTGFAAHAFIKDVCARLREHTWQDVSCLGVGNAFFGGGVTVSGLLTAQDILRSKDLLAQYDRVILPSNLLREGTDVLLDDVTVPQMAQTIGVPITVADSVTDLVDLLKRDT